MRAVRAPDATFGPARSASRSHVGKVRQVNEDRVLDLPDAGLWAVSDGMGGHHGGDMAAQAVIDALRELGRSGQAPSADAIADALGRAHAYIRQHNDGAGATAVVMGMHDGCASISWIGDSRCYRIRDGALQQLTRDHSVVQALIDAGLITPADADHHPQANVITRALGVGVACELDSCRVELCPGDRFLLCSDGLSRTMLTNDLDHGAIETLASRLLERALARDGSDNISLVIVDFDG